MTVFKILHGEAPFPFVEKLIANDGSDAALELSTLDRHTGKPSKPQSYGLDSVAGTAFWLLLAGSATGYWWCSRHKKHNTPKNLQVHSGEIQGPPMALKRFVRVNHAETYHQLAVYVP
jgi:hypothetical protein